MRKAKPAKSLGPSRPNTLASPYFQLPTPHAQTTQGNCLSPFVLVPSGSTSVYAKPLPASLPSSCPCVLAAAFWGLQGATTVFWGREQAAGDGDRVLVECVDSRTAVVSTWFLDGLNGTLNASWQMLASTDGFHFFPLPPSRGVPTPLHILWQLGL